MSPFKFNGLLIFGLIAIDQITKMIAFRQGWSVPNAGFAFGLGSNSPILVRTFCVAALYGAMVYAFLSFCLFVSVKRKTLYHALALLLGGFGGNTIDRTFSNVTIDFIPDVMFSGGARFFNLADVFIAAGLAWVWLESYFAISRLLRDSNQRGSHKKTPAVQGAFSKKMTLSGAMLITSVVLCLVALVEVVFRSSHILLTGESRVLIYGTCIICAVLVLVSYQMMIRYYASTIFGPIFAMKRQLLEVIEDPSRSGAEKLNLRGNDEWPELNGIYSDLVRALRKRE